MLGELLRLLAAGGGHSISELARRLGASEDLVAAMVDDLARRGYLTALEAGCTASCGSCAAAGSCSAAAVRRPSARLLVLTPQGRRAARGPR